MTDFMVLVERAVRPVPAAPGRKQRMREELLAHLVGVYEGERPHLGEAAAREEAARRFGDPAGLTSDLVASLSVRDRVDGWIDRRCGWRPGEPPHRTALRLAAVAGLWVAAVTAVGAGVAVVQRPLDPTVPSAADFLRIGMATLVFGSGGTFLLAWLTGRLRAALAAGSAGRWRAAGCLAGTALLMPLATFVVCLIAVPDWWTGGATAVPRGTYQVEANVLAIVLPPVAAWLFVRSTQAAVARRLEWARLDLGR